MKGYRTAKQKAWQNNQPAAATAAPAPIAPTAVTPATTAPTTAPTTPVTTTATTATGNNGARQKRQNKLMIILTIVAVILVLATVSVLIWLSTKDTNQSAPSETTAEAAVETSIPTPTSVPGTWQMSVGDYGDNCWFAEGIPEISAAKTPEEAKAAAYIWLEEVKVDPTLLSGASMFLLDKWVDKDSLFDKNGFATQVAVDLVAELKLLLDQSEITADIAPSKGYNSGVFDDTVKSSNKAGISGDRHAIKIVRPDGVSVWILGRCGNGVTEKEMPTPTPTPEPTAETTTTTTTTTETTAQPTPTPTTPTLAPKNPEKDPAVSIGVPDGGTNKDPGTGSYVEPTNTVTLPSESRVNPTTPVATVPTTTTTETTAPTPTPVDVAVGDPTWSGTPVIPN